MFRSESIPSKVFAAILGTHDSLHSVHVPFVLLPVPGRAEGLFADSALVAFFVVVRANVFAQETRGSKRSRARRAGVRLFVGVDSLVFLENRRRPEFLGAEATQLVLDAAVELLRVKRQGLIRREHPFKRLNF